MGMLLGVAGVTKALRNGKGLRDMAVKRFEMGKNGGIAKMGNAFKGNDDVLQTILRACKKK